jgi:hypothetical protein
MAPRLRPIRALGTNSGRAAARIALGLLVVILAGTGALQIPVDGTSEASTAQPDPIGGLTSPDVGTHCADGLGPEALTRFFAEPIGDWRGADYQRTVRLPDDRVLWTFQDAFIGERMVHNAAMVQSGRCFTLLGRADRSWLLAGKTDRFERWHWILGGEVGVEGKTVHLFVVEMSETGDHYLARPRPTALRRVVVNVDSLEVVEKVLLEPTGKDLYGWSVTSDRRFTYLYSHCYRQFGCPTLFGFDACSEFVKVARVPRGRLGAARQYWNGSEWVRGYRNAVPVVDGSFAFSGNNPAQIRFNGRRFVLIEKRDDWWGSTVEFGASKSARGPFRHVASIPEPAKGGDECNTYFASWVPWTVWPGVSIWAIGHNTWDGSGSIGGDRVYHPTFHAIGV